MICFSIAALALALPGVGRADDGRICRGTISYGLVDHGLMFDMESGQGIDRDIMAELERRSGCTFNALERPRARVWFQLENGALDMVGATLKTPEREQVAWFALYGAFKNDVIVREALAVRSAADFLADPRLLWGVVRTYRHGKQADAFIDLLRAQGRLVEVSDIRSLFRLFERGKIDGHFAQAVVYTKYFDEQPSKERLHISDWFPDEAPAAGGIALSKRRFSAENAQKWRALIEKMRLDGTLRRIFTRYLGTEEAERMLRSMQDSR